VTRRQAGRLARWAFALVPVVLVVVAIEARWDDVGGVGRLPGWLPTATAVVLNVAGNLLLVQAWRRQVAASGTPAPAWVPATAVWSASQLYRLVFPGAPVGARAVLARRHGVRGAVGAWTAVLELAWTLSIGPFVVLATLPWWGDQAGSYRWLAVAAVLPALLLLWVTIRPGAALRAIVAALCRVPPVARRLPDDLASVGVDLERGDVARLAGLYLLNTAVRLAAFVVLLAGLADLTAALAATAIGASALGRLVGTVAVFAPGGIGPREGVSALVLAPAIGAAALVLVAIARLVEIVAEALVYGGARLVRMVVRHPAPERVDEQESV
jgi:hypothetical protein